jgi:hypothetical protein
MLVTFFLPKPKVVLVPTCRYTRGLVDGQLKRAPTTTYHVLIGQNFKIALDARKTRKKTRVGQLPSEGLFSRSDKADEVILEFLVDYFYSHGITRAFDNLHRRLN